METLTKQTFTFAEFELDAAKRTLLKQGKAVALNSKTFDLLLTLVENRGLVLSKEDLLNRVWANQFVEENNLTVQISALRKIFGEKRGEHQFIVTVPGKGYKFVAELNEPQAGEIIVENHSFSRIVVDEEIEEAVNARVPSNGYEPKAAAGALAPQRKFSVFDNLKNSPAIIFGAVLTIAIIGGANYVWRNRQSNLPPAVPFAGSNIKQLTTNGKVSVAALSPDGKLFAYVTSDLGERSLWLGYVEGGNHLLLRPASEAVYHNLAFSPDGNRLYFSVRDEKTAQSALYKMPVSGGAAQKVLDEITNFKLSPDGRQIAFARRNNAENKDSLFVADLNTAERREVAAFPKTTAIVFNSISWSPDGERLALSGEREGELLQQEIITVEIATGEIVRIKNDDWRDIGGTAWLKDGSGLMITAVAAGSWSSVPQYRIWHVRLPGGETRPVTNDRSSYGSPLDLSAQTDSLLSVEHRQLNNVWVAPVGDLSRARQITFSSFGKYDGLWGMDWTPDGRLVYTNSDTHSQFISEMNADGGAAKPLTAPGMIDSVLTVSPDGRYIVFHSNRAGGFDIWRTDADGSNPTQLTAGGKSYQPFVSADSRWVYYKSWEKQTGELRRVPIDGGAEEPEILNDRETSWGSASPDGKFFAASYVTDKQRLAIFSAETHEVVKQFDLPKTGTLSMGSRWTPDSRAVVFRDNAFGYWSQAVEGGEPQRLEGLPKEKFYNFAFSKDGKSFAFVRGQEIRDVVLFGNPIE